MSNSLSGRMSRALGLWAAILVLMMGLWADIDPATLIMRSSIGFLMFAAMGYLAGMILHAVLPHTSQTANSTEEKDSKDAGEAMESV